jgi:hypothetical protein
MGIKTKLQRERLMKKLEGTITVERRNGILMMVGFSYNDIRFLMKASRKKYSIQSKKTRILKKYVKKLLSEALQFAIEHIAMLDEAPKDGGGYAKLVGIK